MNVNTSKTLLTTLDEAGIPYQPSIRLLDEAKGIDVADSVLTGMFKFITDKYNSLDFREIEQSAGDYMKFKYRQMLSENLVTLQRIYQSSKEDGADKYMEIIRSIRTVENWLISRRSDLSYLYKKKKGTVQVIYTSLVASIIYTIAALVSNTIRFVTVDRDSDLNVLFEEIPNAYKNVHLQNILKTSSSIKEFDRFVNALLESTKKQVVTEASVGDVLKGPGRMVVKGAKAFANTMGKKVLPNDYEGIAKSAVQFAANHPTATKAAKGVVYGVALAGVALLAWKAGVIVMSIIRSFILTVYYSRIKMKDALDINISLLKANIENLENQGADPKVIANQRKWAERLDKIAMKFANDTDKGEMLADREIARQNQQLGNNLGSDSYSYEDDYSSSLLI